MSRRIPLLATLLLLAVGSALSLAAALAAETSPAFELGGDAERARPQYQKLCAPCHGAVGKGDGEMGTYLTPPPKDLTDPEYMRTRTDEQIYLAIKEGGASVGLSEKMSPWKHLLSDEEIRDLAAFVQTLSTP